MRVSENLDVRVSVKVIIPEHVLYTDIIKKAKKLVVLDRLSQQVQNSVVDVRIVRCFRIWQKDSTLNFYLDQMQDKMRQMKRGTVQTRFKFIARQARGKVRRTFARWALNARSVALNQAYAPKPVLTPDSMTLLGLLKLVNLQTKGRANAMGTQ